MRNDFLRLKIGYGIIPSFVHQDCQEKAAVMLENLLGSLEASLVAVVMPFGIERDGYLDTCPLGKLYRPQPRSP